MFKERLLNFLSMNFGKVIGSFLGLLIGILFFTLGFFKTILLIILISLGYYIGNKIDKHESIIEILDKILPPGTLD